MVKRTLLAAGVLMLVSCNGKQTPPLTVLPVEELSQSIDGKEIFRRSDYNNTSSWVVPDDKGNLMIQLGKETYMHNSYRALSQSFGFSMTGGAEGSGRLDVPPVGESESVDVPVSFEVPWSLFSDSVPEIHSRLLALGFHPSSVWDLRPRGRKPVSSSSTVTSP